MTAALPDIEAPSGKGAQDENFPVGSFLRPARLRPQVARVYAFARAIDDIADSPDLQPQDKVDRLEAMEAALTGQADPNLPVEVSAQAVPRRKPKKSPAASIRRNYSRSSTPMASTGTSSTSEPT